MAESYYKEIKFTDADVANPDDAEWEVGNRYNKPWLLHDHGFCICVVWARNEQDALDNAVDANKLDNYKIADEDREQYDEMRLNFLGNASEPFDIETLEMVELPLPKMSFCALFNETQKEKETK